MKCSRCGMNTVEASTVRHEVNVGGAKFVGKLEGRKCTACKEEEVSMISSALSTLSRGSSRSMGR